MRHWFDGLAMLHRFAVADGRVSYANSFLDSHAYRAAREQARLAYREFATDPCRSLFKRVQTLFSSSATSDNANVNVAPLGDRFLAMTETPLPVVFDPRTLRTADVEPPRAPGQLSTAHPHLDRSSGGMLNYAAQLGPRSHYRFFTLDASGAPRVLCSLPVREPAYMHSFGLTERWLVLAEFPLVVNPLALALSGRPYIENYRWKPERGTRFTLVDRRSGAACGGFRTDACFAFHHVNAYEADGEVVVDVCAYPDAGMIEDLYLERLRAGKPVASAVLTRFRLDLRDRSVRQRGARRGGHRAATDQLPPLQRAPLPLHVGQRRRAERVPRADHQGRHPRGRRALVVAAGLLRGRAGVRRAPRGLRGGRRRAAVGCPRCGRGPLLPARTRRRRARRDRARRGPAPHPVRLPRPVRVSADAGVHRGRRRC